jgi:hypothetical protein
MTNITDGKQVQGFVWEAVEELKDILANDEFTYAEQPDAVRKKWREYSVPMVRFIEKYVSQGTTYSEAKENDGANSSVSAYSYDYVRKDTLHEMIGAYCEHKSHSKPSKKAIKNALDETDLLYGIKRTRNEPEDKQIPVYSGLRLELDEELEGGVQGCRVIIEHKTHAHACACVKCSEQSVQVCTPPEEHNQSNTDDSSDESGKTVSSNSANTNDLDIIKAVLQGRESGMMKQDLINSLPYEEKKVERLLKKMLSEGEAYEPKPDKICLL